MPWTLEDIENIMKKKAEAAARVALAERIKTAAKKVKEKAKADKEHAAAAAKAAAKAEKGRARAWALESEAAGSH